MMAPMVMATPPTSRYPHAARLTGEERAMAKFIEDTVLIELEAHRGSERRVDAYLKLNEVFRLDDTDGCVRVLLHHLPVFLRAIHEDLQHTTIRDLFNVAMRTLSYFLYHDQIVKRLTASHVEVFLSDIISRTARTSDVQTFKTCLWLLSMQNIDLTQHDFLPRILETTAQAINNRFKARDVEIQALKGLHLLTTKYKSASICTLSTLRTWFRPVTSRLISSKSDIRQLVAQILLEVATYVNTPTTTLDAAVENELASVVADYAPSEVHKHMTYSRNQEALVLWVLIIRLMKRTLARDNATMNELLAVPDESMRHNDASIRLQSMEAWRYLVATFRADPEWVFRQNVVTVLIKPLLRSFEQEGMVNVLHATVATWRTVVAALMEDYTTHCDKQERTVEAGQQNLKRWWTRWFYKVVVGVLRVVLAQMVAPDPHGLHMGKATIHDAVLATVLDLFQAPQIKREEDAAAASAGSSVTTVAGNSSSQRRAMSDLSQGEDALLDSEIEQRRVTAVTIDATLSVPAFNGNLLALALIIKEIQQLFEHVHAAAATASDAAVQRKLRAFAVELWGAFCLRLHRDDGAASDSPRLRVRFLRMTLGFALGQPSSSSSSSSGISSFESQATATVPPSVESEMTAADLLARNHQGSSSLLELRSQLRMLLALVAAAASSEELRALLLYQKTKTMQQLLASVDAIASQHANVREWLSEWDAAAPATAAAAAAEGGRTRIDFASKANVVPCVLLYLFVRVAAAFDALASDRETLQETVELYNRLAPSLVECVEGEPCTVEIASFLRFIKGSVQATTLLLVQTREGHRGSTDAEGVSAARLLATCTQLASHGEETQDNATALLQLQRSSPVAPRTPDAPATAGRTPGSSEPGSSASPCLLQPTPQPRRPPSTATSEPGSPPPSSTATATATTPTTPVTPSRQRRPSSVSSSSVSSSAGEPPICPEFMGSTDAISTVARHFPAGFRPLFSFYGIETVGDLCGKTLSEIRQFGAKDPVGCVTRALDDVRARQSRPAPSRLPVNSPYRQRLPASSLSAASPKQRPLKRPLSTPTRLPVAPLPSTASPLPSTTAIHCHPPHDHRKKARRSLHELSSEPDDAADSATPSMAGSSSGRVTFQLEGSSRILRPGEDSQEAAAAGPTESQLARERKRLHNAGKLLHCLQRAEQYAKTMSVSEDSVASSEGSLAGALRVGPIFGHLEESGQVVVRVSALLQRLLSGRTSSSSSIGSVATEAEARQ